MERVLTIRPVYLTTPAISATKTLIEFAKASASGNEVPIPRTSLAITSAILAAFPEETDLQISLRKIGQMSPLIIALNERADIGVSAELKVQKGNLTPNQVWGLLMLQGQTESMLAKRTIDFLQKYPQEERVIAAIKEDFLTLSKLRNEFPLQEWPQFLELDSAIFVCAFIHAANPEILQEAGINLERAAKNKEELIAKYHIFTTENTEKLTKTQERLRAIFSAEMLLKVRDDLTDKDDLKIDAILDLPSFARWAKSTKPDNPNQPIEEKTRKYQAEAKILFPRILQIVAEAVSHVTSVIKARNSQNSLIPADDPTNFWRCFTRSSQTTTLRHELEAMCILSELFS